MRKKKKQERETKQPNPPQMTQKQERFVAHFANPESPGFSNATRAAEAAGYRGKPGSNQLAVQGHANLRNPNVRLALEAALARAGCTIELGAKRLRDGLDAKQVRAFVVDGDVVYSKALPDYRERRQAAELVFRLHSLMPASPSEDEHKMKFEMEQKEKKREVPSATGELLHLPEAANATGIAQANSMFEQLRELNSQAQSLKEKAERAGDLKTALAAVRELARIVELTAKLRGELPDGNQTKVLNINLDPEAAKRMVDIYMARHQEPGE